MRKEPARIADRPLLRTDDESVNRRWREPSLPLWWWSSARSPHAGDAWSSSCEPRSSLEQCSTQLSGSCWWWSPPSSAAAHCAGLRLSIGRSAGLFGDGDGDGGARVGVSCLNLCVHGRLLRRLSGRGRVGSLDGLRFGTVLVGGGYCAFLVACVEILSGLAQCALGFAMAFLARSPLPSARAGGAVSASSADSPTLRVNNGISGFWYPPYPLSPSNAGAEPAFHAPGSGWIG